MDYLGFETMPIAVLQVSIHFIGYDFLERIESMTYPGLPRKISFLSSTHADAPILSLPQFAYPQPTPFSSLYSFSYPLHFLLLSSKYSSAVEENHLDLLRILPPFAEKFQLCFGTLVH